MKLQRLAGAGRGLSLVELLVVIVIVGILSVVMLAVFGSRGHRGPRTPKCAYNVRGIHQGMILFSQANRDQYPLPSVLDKANSTVALAEGADPTSKDTTAAIISTLIYGTFFGPETCISPAESNGAIVIDHDYQFAQPRGAVDPRLALWDPAFSADFTGSAGVESGGKGESNFSYAHMMPSGARADKWTHTNFDAAQAVLGNRGPLITGVTKGIRRAVTPAFDTGSNTLLIHGSRTAWEGNIAYNDNHVSFESTMWTESVTYKDAAGAEWLDVLHFDEPDDASGLNNFLGIYAQAGPTPAAFKTIWD
ncbi:MAG: prepilin-type N-terminal cleavage/methylation domain-containing protein [Tepidisphaera sp.]